MQRGNIRSVKRLEKEIEDLKKYDIFHLEVDPDDFMIWKISFQGAEGTLYAGEKYTLRFKFSSEYVLCC